MTFQVLGIKPNAYLTIGIYVFFCVYGFFFLAKLVLVGFCFMHSNNTYDNVLSS